MPHYMMVDNKGNFSGTTFSENKKEALRVAKLLMPEKNIVRVKRINLRDIKPREVNN